MNSKEALKRLKQETAPATYMPDSDTFKEECIKVIEQDLDRLENLEKEHNKLKERYKHRAETANDLCKAVKQYEKAIDILMEVCSLNCNKTLETERHFLQLSQGDYEILKEVFRND